MNKEIIKSSVLNEEYISIKHKSGLTILMHPMEGFNSAHVLFGTNYGSIDTAFKTGEDKDFAEVPEGIAHFLEHKLFENEDGDAFTKYAKTGASANAYTSFENTVYLFSCSENFKQSLEILLSFVTEPYFTPETVKKEQGIIGQEIRMYEDSPGWRVYFNLLQALYHNNPVKIDIAGTVDSISKIDSDLLYRCYNTFYNLNNMVLSVAGSFSPDEVLEVADAVLKPAKDIKLERKTAEEPESIVKSKTVQYLPVALPIFHIGFKCKPVPEKERLLSQIKGEIALNIIAGDSTELYKKLYNEGLINAEFGTDVMAGRGYQVLMFAGESNAPEKVNEEIMAEINKVLKNGIDEELFSRYKKSVYGQCIKLFSKPNLVATSMMNAHFSGISNFEILQYASKITKDDIYNTIKESLTEDKSALSIVMRDIK